MPKTAMLNRLTKRVLGSLRARRWAYFLAALSGVLYFVGFCGFDQWYLAWICLIPVLWALDDEDLSGTEALFIAWAFGLITHMGGYTWIAGMLRKFAYLPWPLAFFGYVLLCLSQGSLLAFWGWSVNRLVTRLKWPIVWVAPVMLVVAEFLYPALFPSYLSNSQYEQLVLIQNLDLWGPLGLTFVLGLSSAVIYQAAAARLRERGRYPLVAGTLFLVLLGGSIGYGLTSIASIDDTVDMASRRVRVGMVQTSMGIYEKFDSPLEGVRRHQEQSLEAQRQGADLIIWPESGYNLPLDARLTNVKRQVLGPITKPMLFGGLRVDRSGKRRKVWNSAYLTNAAGDIQGTYDKTYLLAFGEYLPLGETLPFLYELSPHSSRFEFGDHTRPLELDGLKYGVLICYEDILPRFVNEVMESEPDILVNLTNDAWFGDTREPLIHLALAAFRSVEQRRFMARSTNTGISAIIDPVGRILKPTQVNARANLVHDVTPLQIRTLYARFGDWIGYLCFVLFLLSLHRPIRSTVNAALARLRRKEPLTH